MKKITFIAIASLCYITCAAQIKIDTKNLKKIKNVVNAVSETTPTTTSGNTTTNNNTATVINTPGAKPITGNGQQTQSSASGFDLAGWTTQELDKVVWTGAYLIDGGWMVDKMEFRKKYNEQLTAPVAQVSYWSYCYKVPLTVHIFRMEDKEAVKNFDFEAEATKLGNKGYYKSQMIIADNDKYILIFSYYEKADANMDKYMEEKSADLASRIPYSWK